MWSCFLYYVNLRINVYNSQWHGLCHSHWYLLVIMLLITCHNTWTELQPRCRCEFMRNIWECEWKWHVGKVVILYLSIIRLSHTQKTQWHASVRARRMRARAPAWLKYFGLGRFPAISALAARSETQLTYIVTGSPHANIFSMPKKPLQATFKWW